MVSAILVCLVIFFLAAVLGHFVDDFPKVYRHRRCEGRLWKEQFPDVPKEEIRRFLVIFADAFGFRENHKLKFRPDDRIMDVYNSIYKPVRWADNMELESLFIWVENAYGVCLANYIDKDMDMTLGSLFRVAIEGKVKRGS